MLRILSLLSVVGAALAETSVLDASGSIKLSAIPSDASASRLITVISSPGTPSVLSKHSSSDVLEIGSDKNVLTCRGATLNGNSDVERKALATCSIVSAAIVIDGITPGDVQTGFVNSRHARTLTAVFRARAQHGSDQKQTLVLVGPPDISVQDVVSLYRAAAIEQNNAPAFESVYNIEIVAPGDAGKVRRSGPPSIVWFFFAVISTLFLQIMSTAQSAAASSNKPDESLSSALTAAQAFVRESGVATVALDTPRAASSFVQVGQAYGKQVRVARAKIAAWKSRTARGLLIDAFGRDAASLRQRVLSTMERETLSAVGIPSVAVYRLEMRNSLQNMLDTAIEEVFEAQVANLEKMTLKRFNAQLLRTMNDSPESIVESNSALLTKETLAFGSIMEDLEVPALGLGKERASRAMAAKLNDAVMAFPDSPAAKIKRTQKVTKTVNKDKKPGQKGIDFGLDLVAMLRPDGFGSLQGYAGYQFGGNSVTFGVHNDADDPQVIAQFGGVRPPLLRVQPKLRVDVEM